VQYRRPDPRRIASLDSFVAKPAAIDRTGTTSTACPPLLNSRSRGTPP
jgi:hypothetical protein